MGSRPVGIPRGDGHQWGCPGYWQLPLQAPVTHTYAAGGGGNRDVPIQGISVGVGVLGTGRLDTSPFKNRKRHKQNR